MGESTADNVCFFLHRTNLPLISTLDFMAASHIPEGRSKAELGQVIFILEDPKRAGRTFKHEQVCHGAEWRRNLEKVIQKKTLLKGLKIPKSHLS